MSLLTESTVVYLLSQNGSSSIPNSWPIFKSESKSDGSLLDIHSRKSVKAEFGIFLNNGIIIYRLMDLVYCLS